MLRLTLLFPILVCSVSLAADRTEVLDLGSPVTSRSVPAGESIELIITNQLPKYDYRVKTLRRTIPIPPLTLPEELTTRSAGALCENLGKLFLDELEGLTSEEDIGATVDRYREAGKTCTDEQRGELELAIATLSHSVEGQFVLDPGEELVVTVERDDRTWEYILSTGARGEWRTFYGFNFMPNGDEQFFAAQDPDDPSSFVITRKADRENLDFAPSVFFTWMPASQKGRNWSHGLAAGLGFDTSNPIVFAGYAGIFNENIAVTLGAVFHKQERLDGRYETGQVVTENLAADQLVSETYEPNFYLGIGYRFGSSPFSNGGSSGN